MRAPSEEEHYFLKQSYENVVTSIDHIVKMGTHVVSAVGVVAGLALTAAQLPEAQAEVSLVGPFSCWVVSLFFALLVVFPWKASHAERAPAEIRKAFERIRRVKYRVMVLAVVSFCAGLLWIAVAFNP